MSAATLTRSTNGHVRRVLILTLATLLLFTVLAIVPGAPGSQEARAEVPWVENALKKHEVWDPAPGKLLWVPGHAKGYTEGETAAFRVTVEAESGQQMRFNVCLDFDDSGAYTYTKIEPWNTSHNNMTAPPAFGDLTGNVTPGFNGAGLTIDSVTALGENGGLCPSNYLGWEVTFTMNTTGVAYVVYGGHFAAPGETYSWGTVGDGEGASSAIGVFQARIDTLGGGDKTVPFSGKDIIPLVPDIQIQKATGLSAIGPWHDADNPNGPYIAVGANVYWQYVVTNNGEADLMDVAVTDSKGVTVDCGGQVVLTAGATMTCTASGIAGADLYKNIGTVEAFYRETKVSDTDPSHYFGVDSSIAVVKTGALGLGDDGIANPGDVIAYEFLVTNDGNVPLTSIDVTDLDLGGINVTCPKTALAVGEPMICTADYPIKQADVDRGSVHNCALAAGLDPLEDEVTDEDCFDTDIPETPGILLAKTGTFSDESGDGFAQPGETISYSFKVTNTGNVTLVNVTLADTIGGVAITGGPIASLAAGASDKTTFTGSYALTQADIDAGTFYNMAEACGTDPAQGEVCDEDDHEEPLPQNASILIVKSPDTQTINESENATFKIKVTNNGNVTLTDVVVADALAAACASALGTLDPGESAPEYQCTELNVLDDFTNVAVATGIDPNEATVTDDDDANVVVLHPEFALKRGVCEEELVGNAVILDKPYLEWTSKNWPAGATLKLKIWESDGTTVYSDEVVAAAGKMLWPGYDDSGFDPATGIGGIIYPPAELRPIYIQMYTNPDTGAPVEVAYPPATEGCTPNPAIEVQKDVEPAVIPVNTPGDITTEVTWTITVTNTGDSLLQNVTLTDALVPVCDLAIGNLDAGASVTQTCKSLHTPDSLAWTFTNVAVATGVGLWGSTVTDDDDATIDPVFVKGTAQLGDTVFLDNDKDGVQDADDPGINGAKVVLKDANGTVIATLTTAKNAWDGFYKFLSLDAGTYTVSLDMSSVDGDLTTAGAFTIDLADGEDYTKADFGVAEVLPKTGMDAAALVLLGLALLAAGAVAVLFGRRRGENT